jgi:hypothetical protein
VRKEIEMSKYTPYVKEIEEEGSAEDNGVVGPCRRFEDRDFGDDYDPKENPEEVEVENLIKILTGDSSKKNGCKLIIKA